MITERSIQRFCSATLIICTVAAFAVSMYFGYWNILLIALFVALFIFAVSFVMEWFHLSFSGLVLRLIARFQSHKSKHKNE